MTKYQERLSMLKSWANHDASLYRSFTKTVMELGYTLDDARILDIGCGANAPMTLMLHSAGVKVTRIDEYIGYRWGLGFRPGRYRSYLAQEGLFKNLWGTEFTEGEDLITDKLLGELPGYTREELTKRCIVVILRKRSAS